jgi:hypothetical protein
VGLSSTNRVPLRSVPTHSQHTPTLANSYTHVFPPSTLTVSSFPHAFLFGNSRFTFKKWIKLNWKGKHINQSKQLPFELCVDFLPYPYAFVWWPPHLTCQIRSSFLAFSPIYFIFFHFLQPKSLSSHWLLSQMSCLVPWILDTCWRSKRGLLSSSSYLRDLSLPLSSPFIIVLLCYHFLTISFSSSLIIIVTFLHWCGSWRT